jgi:tRNA threonylcarbamoyladenosine biosynthesis protein TsaB
MILAMDTSGDVCSVAIVDGAKLIAEINFQHNRRLTERLPGIIAFLLSDAGLTLEQIDVFAVGLGPGSFTGVRVGVTMMKTWAEVYQKRLIGVSSLDALSRAASGTATAVVAIAPSRKEEVIAAFYAPNKPNPKLGPEAIATDLVIPNALETLGDAPILIVGECVHWLTPSPRVTLRPISVRAFWVARLGDARLRVYGPDDPAMLVPLYIAPPPIRGKLGESISSGESIA